MLIAKDQRRWRGSWLAGVKGGLPCVERDAEGAEVQRSVLLGIERQVATGAGQDGAAADDVSARVMMQGDGHLYEALEEPSLGLGGGAPDVFKDLVGLEKLAVIQQVKAAAVGVGMGAFGHSILCFRLASLYEIA